MCPSRQHQFSPLFFPLLFTAVPLFIHLLVLADGVAASENHTNSSTTSANTTSSTHNEHNSTTTSNTNHTTNSTHSTNNSHHNNNGHHSSVLPPTMDKEAVEVSTTMAIISSIVVRLVGRHAPGYGRTMLLCVLPTIGASIHNHEALNISDVHIINIVSLHVGSGDLDHRTVYGGLLFNVIIIFSLTIAILIVKKWKGVDGQSLVGIALSCSVFPLCYMAAWLCAAGPSTTPPGGYVTSIVAFLSVAVFTISLWRLAMRHETEAKARVAEAGGDLFAATVRNRRNRGMSRVNVSLCTVVDTPLPLWATGLVGLYTETACTACALETVLEAVTAVVAAIPSNTHAATNTVLGVLFVVVFVHGVISWLRPAFRTDRNRCLEVVADVHMMLVIALRLGGLSGADDAVVIGATCNSMFLLYTAVVGAKDNSFLVVLAEKLRDTAHTLEQGLLESSEHHEHHE
eukprot:PhM_4_TR7876/c0_g1_i1/m.13942